VSNTGDMTDELSQLMNEAVARLSSTRRTFTEREALIEIWNAGYEVSIQSDPRFVLAQEQGKQPSHWRLSSHTLANNRLLHDLLTDIWDGRDLDIHLAELDTAEQTKETEEQTPHYVYCPLDSRLVLNKQGVLELREQERNIAVPRHVQTTLDTLEEHLLTRWREAGESGGGVPWTLRTIIEELQQLGWRNEGMRNAHLYVRAWLLRWPAVVRVGQDYWMLADALPQEIQRTRLGVLPVYVPRGQEATTWTDGTGEEYVSPTIQRTLREHSGNTGENSVLVRGEATAMRATWSLRLRTAHLLEGFLPIPARARIASPLPVPGEQIQTLLRGVWFDDNTHFWLWLNRVKQHFHGPMLADKLAWQAAGDIVQIEWEQDVVVFRVTGHDDEVENEESRLVDLDALSTLRGGMGESYRRSLQEILSEQPEGLPFASILTALRERQHHEVHRGTIHALLSNGGFVQKERRWFAAPDTTIGARSLRNALIETLVLQEQEKQGNAGVVDATTSAKIRVKVIRTRLTEIVERLQRDM